MRYMPGRRLTEAAWCLANGAPDISTIALGALLLRSAGFGPCIPGTAKSRKNHWICVITRCAETGRVPPAKGVMVSAVELPAGLRTVSIELTTVVVTRDIPAI